MSQSDVTRMIYRRPRVQDLMTETGCSEAAAGAALMHAFDAMPVHATVADVLTLARRLIDSGVLADL